LMVHIIKESFKFEIQIVGLKKKCEQPKKWEYMNTNMIKKTTRKISHLPSTFESQLHFHNQFKVCLQNSCTCHSTLEFFIPCLIFLLFILHMPLSLEEY
jgi:hypothetical protein